MGNWVRSGLDAFTPKGMMRLALGVLEEGADAAHRLAPQGEASLGFQEFRNKLRAFTVFEYIDQVLGLSGGAVSLGELVARASRLDPYDAVWATEGVGHYYTEISFAGGDSPRNLLCGLGAATLPETALIALHAGMGLSCAHRVLRTIGSRCCGSSVANGLQRFLAMCEHNAAEGYTGVAQEALGLATRNLHPQLVPVLDEQLAGTNAELRGLFWHGVGRALYFAPSSSTPFSSSPWTVADLALREPPDEAGRHNAVAGLVWALALVNIREPRVLEGFLKHHAGRLPRPALRNGLSSAILVWHDCSPQDGYIGGLLRHQPDAGDRSLQRTWEELVRQPAEEAINRYYPVLHRQRKFGGLFHYRDLPEWISSLEREPVRQPPEPRVETQRPQQALGGLVEQMIGRPVAAFVSGMEMLQGPVGMQTIDGMVSRILHILSGAAPLVTGGHSGSRDGGGQDAGID